MWPSMSDETDNGQAKVFKIALTVDRSYNAETLKAILSTILFLRLFGSLAPSTGEAMGVAYPKVANPEIDSLLTTKIREFTTENGEHSAKIVDARVEFYERRVKKTAWFAKTHNCCWESWRIQMSSPDSPSKQGTSDMFSKGSPANSAARKESAVELQRALLEIVAAADNNKEHIPPITTTDVAPFPYEIMIST